MLCAVGIDPVYEQALSDKLSVLLGTADVSVSVQHRQRQRLVESSLLPWPFVQEPVTVLPFTVLRADSTHRSKHTDFDLSAALQRRQRQQRHRWSIRHGRVSVRAEEAVMDAAQGAVGELTQQVLAGFL